MLSFIHFNLLSFTKTDLSWTLSVFNIDCDYFDRSFIMLGQDVSNNWYIELLFIRITPR